MEKIKSNEGSTTEPPSDIHEKLQHSLLDILPRFYELQLLVTLSNSDTDKLERICHIMPQRLNPILDHYVTGCRVEKAFYDHKGKVLTLVISVLTASQQLHFRLRFQRGKMMVENVTEIP